MAQQAVEGSKDAHLAQSDRALSHQLTTSRGPSLADAEAVVAVSSEEPGMHEGVESSVHTSSKKGELKPGFARLESRRLQASRSMKSGMMQAPLCGFAFELHTHVCVLAPLT